MSINLKPEKVKLHASFASIFYLTDDAAGYYVGAFALTAIGTTHSAAASGATRGARRSQCITS